VDRALHDPTWLWKEARESWDYLVTDELVYAVESIETHSVLGATLPLEGYLNDQQFFEFTFSLGGGIYAAMVEFAKPEDMRASRNPGTDLQEIRNDNLMLVDAIEFMEPPQIVNIRPIRSIVRLKLFDDWVGSGKNIPELTPPSGGFLVELTGRVEDGEFRTSTRIISDKQSQLPSQMIEGRSQIESNIANQNPPANRRLLANFKCEDFPRLISIFYGDNGAWIQLHEVPEFPVKDIEVFLRPINLQPNVIQRLHMLYSNHGQGREDETADTDHATGRRDSDPDTGRVREESTESGEVQTFTEGSPEEVESQTELGHHSDDCNAKHTHLGSLEDA
jgi:hypothetical protein